MPTPSHCSTDLHLPDNGQGIPSISMCCNRRLLMRNIHYQLTLTHCRTTLVGSLTQRSSRTRAKPHPDGSLVRFMLSRCSHHSPTQPAWLAALHTAIVSHPEGCSIGCNAAAAAAAGWAAKLTPGCTPPLRSCLPPCNQFPHVNKRGR